MSNHQSEKRLPNVGDSIRFTESNHYSYDKDKELYKLEQNGQIEGLVSNVMFEDTFEICSIREDGGWDTKWYSLKEVEDIEVL